MTRDNIIKFWGRENLARWTEASLKDVAIPASSKSYLIEVGLPSRADWMLRFEPQASVPRLPKRPNYRRIGYDDMVPICLDESHEGRVIAAEEAVGGKDRYINANVELFGECLVYYQQYRLAARGASDAEAEKLIADTEGQLRKADPSAFKDRESWWPVIIEQMKQGLL